MVVFTIPKNLLEGHQSQGCFEFGSDCAKKVVTRNVQQVNETPSIDWAKFYKSTTKEQMFNMAYQYAMLMNDEDELKAFEFLKEEKNRRKTTKRPPLKQTGGFGGKNQKIIFLCITQQPQMIW